MDGLKARLSFDAVAYDYDDEYLTIDTDTHTININNVSRLFGVQYDGNSKLIKFRIRNKLSDIQKMQDSIVYINWIDSRGVKGQSIAINKTINNDNCEFAWKVPFDALKNSGVLHFAMSAVMTKNSLSVIDQRWSTQIASVITPDGIYIKSYTPSSEEEDRIAQIYNELSKMINKQNDDLNKKIDEGNTHLQARINSLMEEIGSLTSITKNILDINKMPVYENINGVSAKIKNDEYIFSGMSVTSFSKYSQPLPLVAGKTYTFYVFSDKQINSYIMTFNSDGSTLQKEMIAGNIKRKTIKINDLSTSIVWSIGGYAGVDYGERTTIKLQIEDSNGTYPYEYIPHITANDFVAREKILQSERKEYIGYVSVEGSDLNDGFSRSTPFKTIQKAIDSGIKNIFVKEGIYTDGISISGKSGIHIALDRYYDSFSAGKDEDNPKIIIDGSSKEIEIGINIYDSINCSFSDFEIKNCYIKGVFASRCQKITFNDCIVHDIGIISPSNSVGGFVFQYIDADVYNCIAYNIGTTKKGNQKYHCDGFNIHYTGTTNFINCSAWNCEDDGISHHDACCGVVNGGEWYNCGKGGVATPTHGAKINISNVYCHDNNVGIYAGNDSAITDRGNIILSNCVCKNNYNKDMIISDYYKLIAINCIYDTIQGSKNITRFGNAN